jgi:LDH2 family malate/lactate/ureidoglycolate dehydrogenase
MVIKSAEQLLELVAKVLTAAGASDGHAARVAEHLVAASLRGVDTHGVYQITRYVLDLVEGRTDPTAEPIVKLDAPVHALVSGQWTFGHVAAYKAMSLAIEKASEHGTAVVGLVESGHIGRVGHYVEMAARQNMIAMVFGGGYCRSAPRTIPYRGSRGALDTNPIAMAFAGPDPQAPAMFDFATTAAAGGKIDIACRRHTSMPADWTVDKHGNPATTPEQFKDGGYFVPFGKHKGYAMSFAAEVLGSVFTGADAVASSGPSYPMFDHQGVSMIVMKADLFQPLEQFAASLQDRVDCIRKVPSAPGRDAVLVPGDPERTTRLEREQTGIPIHDDDWRDMCAAALTVGCRFD